MSTLLRCMFTLFTHDLRILTCMYHYCRASAIPDETRTNQERADLLGARMFGRWKSVRYFSSSIYLWDSHLP